LTERAASGLSGGDEGALCMEVERLWVFWLKGEKEKGATTGGWGKEKCVVAIL